MFRNVFDIQVEKVPENRKYVLEIETAKVRTGVLKTVARVHLADKNGKWLPLGHTTRKDFIKKLCEAKVPRITKKTAREQHEKYLQDAQELVSQAEQYQAKVG